MVGVQGEEALAHVHQALSYPDQEQHGGLLVIVAAQTPQQPRQPSIVGAAAHYACNSAMWILPCASLKAFTALHATCQVLSVNIPGA